LAALSLAVQAAALAGAQLPIAGLGGDPIFNLFSYCGLIALLFGGALLVSYFRSFRSARWTSCRGRSWFRWSPHR